MVIECIGLPGSGKTFLFDKLSEELRQREVEYVNVSERCMNSILWKIGKKLARALIFLSGDARRYRDGMRKLIRGREKTESCFGIFKDPEYTIRSAALLIYLYQRMMDSHKIYLFDEGLVHTLVKFCADHKVSGRTFLRMASMTERRLSGDRIVVLNEISLPACLESIALRNRHICEFDELSAEQLSEILGEYARLNDLYKERFGVLAVRREDKVRVSVSRIIGRIKKLLAKASRKAAQ